MDKVNEKTFQLNQDTHSDSYSGYEFDYRESRDLAICECGYERCDPKHDWGPGERKFYLLHLVISGKGKVLVDGKEYELKGNCMFLQYPGKKYYYEADEKDPWEYVWVGFNGNRVLNYLDGINFNFDNFVLKLKDSKEILEYFNGLLKTYKEKRVNEARAMANLYGILAYLTTKFPKKSRSKEFYENQMFVNVFRYIELNYNVINVSAIAKMFYYDRSSVFRMFDKKLGVSPSVFLETYKLYCACKLMQSTNKTITDVAYAVGYNNYNWFFTVFKRRLGVVPEKFIQLTKEEQNELMEKLSLVQKAKEMFKECERLINI